MGQFGGAIFAIAVGLLGALAFYWLLNKVVEALPPAWENRLKPYVFIGPAIVIVATFLVFPALLTIRDSFHGSNAEEFVGLANYRQLLGDGSVWSLLLNNAIWIVVVPTVAVSIGLAVAIMTDRLSSTWERVTKALIFLPMAISFIGAGVIWRFVYEWRPPGRPQIGLLNAIVEAMGFEPIHWLGTSDLRLNTLLLTVIMIWLQSGFAMVLLSAAIKGVPDETVEAARIDGASEGQIYWRVVIPQIKSTIFVVTTTVMILVMKIFDVVFALTQGRFNTNVIANQFYFELFQVRHQGRAAVLVVLLIIAVIPIMIANIRRLRQEEALR
ncbi:sugar ABC transporter permease [Egibacter rhizosphaerae]|uniref:Sugar ABC transporter permease n=1 Tax=Egibacter rhizosphaerae TaxID=1670831 RepID=A0A411YA73_9ACTN|nr:sugar ABC transporter permease [Egibacter rhizosphaerae]QBI18111.1 sugar ABC transporter permease [Egibacter rhizosphaerae]